MNPFAGYSPVGANPSLIRPTVPAQGQPQAGGPAAPPGPVLPSQASPQAVAAVAGQGGPQGPGGPPDPTQGQPDQGGPGYGPGNMPPTAQGVPQAPPGGPGPAVPPQFGGPGSLASLVPGGLGKSPGGWQPQGGFPWSLTGLFGGQGQ